MEYSIMIALQVDQDQKEAKKIFKKEGYHNIAYAENSLELLLYCANNSVDVLLIDMSFPFMDCLSMLRYMKDNKLAKVIIAVDDSWENTSSTLHLDCVDIFVTKPIEARKIIPGLLVGISRKEKLEQLEQEFELAESELKFQKNSSYALQMIMDKMNLSEEKANAYLQKAAELHGTQIQEACEMIYAVLCNRKNVIK